MVENLPLPFDRRVWQEATALHDDGWDVAIICPKSERFPESYVELDGIHVYRHSLPLEASGKLGFFLEYFLALFHEFRLLWKIYFKHGFEIIQACNPPDLMFIPALPFKWMGKKFVFDHHDICPELFAVKFGRRGMLYKTLLFFEKCTYRAADFVVTANEAFRELAIKRTGKNPDQIVAVYSVPNSANMRRLPARNDLHKDKRILVGYMGIIGNQDGVDHLVRAMAHLKYELGVRDVGAVIVGDGPDLTNVKALATELQVADDILFTGYLTGEDLMSTLSTVDIGVIPDPMNEYNDKISMNKVFEYSALGIPIVSYQLSETTRLLGNAVEIAPGDTPEGLAVAIQRLLNDVYRNSMAKKALQLSQKQFSWDQEKQKYLKVFNDLIEAPGKNRMRSLNQLQWLRRALLKIKFYYYTRIWGMKLHPTCSFSLSAKFDKTYPAGVHVGKESYIAFDAAILCHDMTRGLYLDTVIGKRCFIGGRAVILPGVTIGDGCIIGAGSVVTKDVPPHCIAAGNPAKVIESNITTGPFGRLDYADTNQERLLKIAGR